jgi:hypothetical protein
LREHYSAQVLPWQQALQPTLAWGGVQTVATATQNNTKQSRKLLNYEAWKELMGDRGRITQVVTKDNFDTFVKMHEAMEDGDYEKAAEYRKELGLGQRLQDGTGYRGNGQHKGWAKVWAWELVLRDNYSHSS